jgi:hypothetical protein
MQLAVDFKSERVVELERMALNDWWFPWPAVIMNETATFRGRMKCGLMHCGVAE